MKRNINTFTSTHTVIKTLRCAFVYLFWVCRSWACYVSQVAIWIKQVANNHSSAGRKAAAGACYVLINSVSNWRSHLSDIAERQLWEHQSILKCHSLRETRKKDFIFHFNILIPHEVHLSLWDWIPIDECDQHKGSWLRCSGIWRRVDWCTCTINKSMRRSSESKPAEYSSQARKLSQIYFKIILPFMSSFSN
jgi:hypothetical protein